MSGPCCPDCGCPSVRPAGCPWCGWKGNLSGQPRKILFAEDLARWGDRVRAKERGETVVLRITLADAAPEDVDFAIMDVLGLDSLSRGAGPLVIPLPAAPAAEALSRLRELPGVARVEIV